MKEVCVFLADGFEEVEALTNVDLLRRAGIKVNVVSVNDSLEAAGANGIKVICDMMFDEIDPESCDMLFLPGGMPGTKNLEAHTALRELIVRFNDEGKKLAAICAAPSVYGKMGLLEGKQAVCYPGFEEFLYGASIPETGSFVTDGNITTSRGAGTAMDLALELITILEGEDKAKEVKESIIYGKY